MCGSRELPTKDHVAKLRTVSKWEWNAQKSCFVCLGTSAGPTTANNVFWVWCGAGEHDRERVAEAVPADDRHNKTCEDGRGVGGVQDTTRDGAAGSNPGRSSRSGHMGKRRERVQSWAFQPGGGPRREPSSGLHTLWGWCSHMHRTKPGSATNQTGPRNHTPAF